MCNVAAGKGRAFNDYRAGLNFPLGINIFYIDL